MTPLDILRGARELLAKPEAWTVDALARGRSEREVKVHGRSAVCFCLIGSLHRIAGRKHHAVAHETRKVIQGLLPVRLAFFNDAPTTTHADVLALLDKGIAQLETQ